jgi:hypothetical protein
MPPGGGASGPRAAMGPDNERMKGATSNQSLAAAELSAADGAGKNPAANSSLGVGYPGWDL